MSQGGYYNSSAHCAMRCSLRVSNKLALFATFSLSTLVIVSGSESITSYTPQESLATNRPPTSAIHSHSHVVPLLVLNETEILLEHAPEPLSYWTHDFDEAGKNSQTLMGLHVFGMIFAFFFLLPVGIALRSARHPWHGAMVVSFGLVSLLSTAAGSLYKKFTSDLYENAMHGPHGFLVLALFAALAVYDAFSFLRRAAAFLRSEDRRNIRVFWRAVILNQEDSTAAKYISLVRNASEESATAKSKGHNGNVMMRSRHVGSMSHENTWGPRSPTPRDILVTDRFHSASDLDSTTSLPLDDAPTVPHTPTFVSHEPREDCDHEDRFSQLTTIGHAIFAIAERSLLILGLMQVVTGTVVYTGMCRQKWISGCIGHLIKGGITVCLGLVSFGRYLGLWSDLGWAWNIQPPSSGRNLTAEAVESLFFVFYGVVMTFTERVGTEPGPFTSIQLQHISIAVMYWVAGMLGYAIESKILRGWLSAPAHACAAPDDPVSQPSSCVGSFNPFPALVVGVTGVSISVHPQKYIFEVKLHALWGYLLVGFAMLRCLTYFFLWLRPPSSSLPSRPPTEAVASFFLTCGGLLLMLSTEQIEFAAMRSGYDDVMLLFNLAVAATYVAFLWTFSAIAFKGWLASKSMLL